ncbi:hypothetical protein WJX72_011795 [[Myrmecia] bisecta]|uniref:Uncharacterized protein n=1 Tax=[Myrmecia] bisecta TaxID=41462 RepID=A0AAW1PEZ9_9CHLO
MDGLVDYSDSSADDSDSPAEPRVKPALTFQPEPSQQGQTAIATAEQSSATQNKAEQSLAPRTLLPDAATLLSGGLNSSVQGPASGLTGVKRPQHQMTGAAARPMQAAQRTGKSPPGRAAVAPSGLLLPPQLRGRSNVVTEDLDRLFAQKRKLNASQPVDEQKQP